MLKIIYRKQNNECGNICPFIYNRKGEFYTESNISLYYDRDKYVFTLSRKKIMGKIFDNVKNNGKYTFLLGEKDLEKTDFAESLCVYLYERKIINSYEIFRIYSDFDFDYMINIFNEYIKNKEKITNEKKNIKIIKFGINVNKDKDKKSINYLKKIYNNFCDNKDNNLFFIFIFDTENEQKDKIDEFIPEEIKIEKEKNIFYPILNEKSSIRLLNDLIEGKGIDINYDEKIYLVSEKAEYKPRKIKIISELLLHGLTVVEIKNMKTLESTNIELIKENSSYPLYYLLSNMPSGLPNSFLKLIFKNYDDINDDKNIITKSKNNGWNIIIKNKNFEENFKEIKYYKPHISEKFPSFPQIIKF